jgi:hypothetical protein
MKPKKSKFKKMSLNEWLGDPATHFLKSGSAFRNKENDALKELSVKLPQKSPSGLNVEYDITYDFPEKVHGYKYTDCLTKMVYVAPCSMRIAKDNISKACAMDITPHGEYVFESLAFAAKDKYVQSSEYEEHVSDEIIMLPGTNLLTINDYVDFAKVDELVKRGAKVKLHPVTSKVWCTMLERRWGKAVIPKRVSAYGLMRRAKKVHFTMSSETGMSCVLLGKEIGLIQQRATTKQSTFEAIYRGMDGCQVKRSLPDKMKALLSHPESGLITVFHREPEQRVQQFFEHMLRSYPHKEVNR